MFCTALGKSANLNMALFDVISILNFGIVVSVNLPFTIPETLKSPSVLTSFKFAAYASGTKPKKFLNEEVGVLKLKSYNCPSSKSCKKPLNSNGNSFSFALLSLNVYLLFFRSKPKTASSAIFMFFM